MSSPARGEAPLFSVVVCTYNRSRLMERAVRSLVGQALDPGLFEILVVDNRSTDDTGARCRRLAAGSPNLRCCFEERQGLSHARNRGWREARGEYVGYLDDDAEAPADWLTVAAEVAGRHHPVAFGGPYYPRYESPRPPWFKDSYESREPASAAGPLPPTQDLSGGNMFWRRDALERLGGFDPRLGMAGDSLGYGEETDLQTRLRRSDPEALLFYEPLLRVLHLARREKLSLLWRARRIFANGRARALCAPGPEPLTPALAAELAMALARLAGQLTVRTLARDRGRYPAWQNYVYEVALGHLREVGRIVALMERGGQRSSIRR